jgi:Tol biopolymer transport system component
VKQELERVEIPGEVEAYGRTWAVLEAAFESRTPVPQRSQWPRVAVVAVALAALLASAFSPPGQAVIDEIREVVGVERAERALFALPSSGRLLVASDAGVWVVQADGSRRLLGNYREASWSPLGRFVVAARADELAALEADGTVRWTLARPGVRTPRWTGTESNTRVAYIDRSGLRVVAGDGTGDRLVVRGFAGPIAWRPGTRFVLAYATAREINVIDAETGERLWRRARTGGRPVDLAWSSDGRRLVAVAPRPLVVYDGRGGIPYELGPGAAPVTAASLAPSGRSLVFAQQAGRRAQVWVVPRIRPDASAARRLFSGSATFDQLSWTPEGRWVVVAWPAADQWVFVRANGAGIRAVANVSEQFRSRSFPRIEGWCCAP